jgi:hypothetical protein
LSEDVEGYITVQKAANALHRSTEQVRRYLREGKLEGRRIGGQWFIREPAVLYRTREQEEMKEEYKQVAGFTLERINAIERINRRREVIRTRWDREGITMDAVALVEELREESK